MFKEFLILISDYYSISKKYISFDIVVPFCISLLIVYLGKNFSFFNDSYLGQIIVLLGILAGFNTTAISVLTSTSNKNIDKLKNTYPQKRIEIGGKKVSLFQILYINISYVILLSFIVIIFCILGCLLPIRLFVNNYIFLILSFVITASVIHILFLNIRNITFLYFSFFRWTIICVLQSFPLKLIIKK